MSFTTRYLNFETLHHYFRLLFNKVIYYILNNIEYVKKIHFLIYKYVCCDCTLVLDMVHTRKQKSTKLAWKYTEHGNSIQEA